MKRIVRMLQLKDDPQLVADYCRVHKAVWPEITAGIKQVGISAMDIFLIGHTAVMILEYPDNLDIDDAFRKLALLPRQAEWEEYVARFQQCEPGQTSAEKWKDMEQVFGL